MTEYMSPYQDRIYTIAWKTLDKMELTIAIKGVQHFSLSEHGVMLKWFECNLHTQNFNIEMLANEFVYKYLNSPRKQCKRAFVHGI